MTKLFGQTSSEWAARSAAECFFVQFWPAERRLLPAERLIFSPPLTFARGLVKVLSHGPSGGKSPVRVERGGGLCRALGVRERIGRMNGGRDEQKANPGGGVARLFHVAGLGRGPA